MAACVVSLPRTEMRLLEGESECEEVNEIMEVLWEIIELVENYDFVHPDDLLGLSVDHPLDTVDSDEAAWAAGGADVRESGDQSDSEEEWSVSSISSDGSEVPVGLPYTENVCNRCKHEESVIESRGFGWEDWLELCDMGDGEELICRSCAVYDVGKDFCCTDCGYSEILCKQYHGEQLGQFYREGETRPEYQDENTRCHGCRARVERYEREEGRVNRVLFPDNEQEEGEVPDDWAETYEGEFEPAEEPEDNTEEKNMRVKKKVQEIGEVLFDIKDKITEGEYLRLMDCLQSVTNEMNN